MARPPEIVAEYWFAWWVLPYVHGVRIFAFIMQMEPNDRAVREMIMRGLRISVCGKRIR